MHETLTGSRAFLGHLINYYLLTDIVGGEEVYGLMVKYRNEQISVRNLTSRRGDVLRFLDCLLRGAVTPVAVRDVIDDWLLV